MVASLQRLHGVQEKLRTPRCVQWDLLERWGITVASPWHLHWTPWGLLGRHATARTLCMHKVCAVARRSQGDLNERRENAVGSQRQCSNSTVRSPRAPWGRRAHAVGMHIIAARAPPYTTIIRKFNEGIKKNIDKSRNFNFQNLIFSHFVRLNIAIKRIPHIFRGCVPEMFVTLYSVTYCIYIPGKPGFCFHYYCAVYDEFKYFPLFVHNTISLSSLCKLIWRHWTYKMPVRYILSSV